MKHKIIFLTPILFLFSCGTGPWFMNKKVYRTFKEDIYTFPQDSLNTNGYYLQVGELPPRVHFRNAIIFYKNGYTTNFRLSDGELESEIKTKITQKKGVILKDLNWWKIRNDSLIIEHYAEMKIEMVTSNYFEKGNVINDSLIKLKFEDSPYAPVTYKFIATDSLPIIKNKARYLKKGWYINSINENRKTTTNTVRN